MWSVSRKGKPTWQGATKSQAKCVVGAMCTRFSASVAMINEPTMSQRTNKIPLSQSPRSGTRNCVTIWANDDQNSLDLSACDKGRI